MQNRFTFDAIKWNLIVIIKELPSISVEKH